MIRLAYREGLFVDGELMVYSWHLHRPLLQLYSKIIVGAISQSCLAERILIGWRLCICYLAPGGILLEAFRSFHEDERRRTSNALHAWDVLGYGA